MLEAYLLAVMVGIGWVVNQNWSLQREVGSAAQVAGRVPKNEVPSMDSVYESNRVQRVQQFEERASARKARDALDPVRTSVIPGGRVETPRQPAGVQSRLAGVTIPVEKFTHNNMLPFFGSTIKQNTDADSLQTPLQVFTGVSDLYKPKREAEAFFQTAPDLAHVAGAPNATDFYYNRVEAPVARRNEFPIQQVQVGPGVANGYTGAPEDVLISARDYVLPKSVDDLRVASKPKLTNEGRVVAGQGMQKQVGDIGQFNKYRPETFRQLTQDDYFRGPGAVTADAQRPEVLVKETTRPVTHKEYMGTAYNSKSTRTRPQAAPSKRPELDGFQVGAAHARYGQEGDTYGKSGIQVYANERDVTTVRTHQANLTSMVKAVAAPLLDAMRHNKKEYVLHNPREYGNLQPTFPDSITVYDPNDVARTTLKETLIHDGDNARNLKTARTATQARAPGDAARATTRQTLDDVDTSLNLGSAVPANVAYDPESVMPRTTTKETTVESERDGNVEALEKRHGSYLVTPFEARATQKQSLSQISYYGIADKQGVNSAYDIVEVEAKPTQKQSLSQRSHVGTAKSVESTAPTSYDAAYNAEIDPLKELLLQGRDPTQTSVKVTSGMESMNAQSLKQTLPEQASHELRVSSVYQPTTTYMGSDTTKTKQAYENYGPDRNLDRAILSALDTNPYVIHHPSYKPPAGSERLPFLNTTNEMYYANQQYQYDQDFLQGDEGN